MAKGPVSNLPADRVLRDETHLSHLPELGGDLYLLDEAGDHHAEGGPPTAGLAGEGTLGGSRLLATYVMTL